MDTGANKRSTQSAVLCKIMFANGRDARAARTAGGRGRARNRVAPARPPERGAVRRVSAPRHRRVGAGGGATARCI